MTGYARAMSIDKSQILAIFIFCQKAIISHCWCRRDWIDFIQMIGQQTGIGWICYCIDGSYIVVYIFSQQMILTALRANI